MDASVDLPSGYRQIFAHLKQQVDTSLRSGLKRQSIDFIEEFAYTYLQGLGILAQIRANPDWKQYIAPCQQVLIQANLLLYPEETEKSPLWKRIFLNLPASLWRQRYFHLAALLLILATTLVGYIIVLQNHEMASVFIPSGLRSNAELDGYLFSTTAQQQMLTAGRNYDVGMKSLFASFLFLNNIKVAMLCFVSGCLYGIPTFLLLVQTGLMMGALPALFAHDHWLGIWAWLLPHGVPEISAIVLAGGAGLKVGLTMLNPGPGGMQVAFRETIKSVSVTMLFCGILLIWAALVESFLRQSTLPDDTRLCVAGFSALIIAGLFVWAWQADKLLSRKKRLP